MAARASVLCLIAALALAGCNRSRGGDSDDGAPAQTPSADRAQQVALGAPPGEAIPDAGAIANPYEGDPQAIAQGQALFGSMNCVYCHGAQGSGLMGPPLNGSGWRYGGAPVLIYNSIHDGRPQGMPAWRGRLTSAQIWQLVAYIESLGGAAPPATAKMPALATPQPSTTGPQVSGQSATDSARAALLARPQIKDER